MQNLISLWTALSLRRRIIVVGATIAMFAAVISLSRLATAPGMALLYAGLDGAAAGEVVRVLEQRGVRYEVSGDAIRVEAGQRDVLRMTLAGEGLPTRGGAGYELLDGLSGFGTTSQMFDAAYWRAKEGELARTITATPSIRAARVHLAQMPSQPFQRAQKSTASVTVTTSAGQLTASQAKALRHLISAAVAGMLPEDVAVIDSVAGLIGQGEDPATPSAGGDARAAELKRSIERLLAAHVGPGRAIVEVAVEVETARESVVERRFDPQGRVVISSETEERSNSASQAAGDVTVASNLPDGAASAGSQGASSGSETREKINYEVSETQREVLRTPGALRRISVAVLVDGQRITGTDGRIELQPRGEDELAVLRELVTSAAGLDPARGDVLTLKSLAFEPIPEMGSLAEASLLTSLGPLDVMSAIQMLVLALVALTLGLFVIRPLVISGTGRAALGRGGALALPTGGEDGGPNMLQSTAALTGEIEDQDLPDFPMVAFNSDALDAEEAEPAARLRRLIDERQAETLEILRGWMEMDEEEKA